MIASAVNAEKMEARLEIQAFMKSVGVHAGHQTSIGKLENRQ